MKAKTLKITANELRIEVEGVGHTLCNLLQKRLLEDAHVESAGYDVPHPLASNAIIYVRTRGKVSPQEALHTAVEKIRETNREFGKDLQRVLKKT
ncbi:DNA-directed RNA polymerase subunit L [Candidatus Bathyarchaeota archaeon]|nr:DNA-directed RNA polymerase subunit L [Candidatus Bathyarchaeota archaeon]